MYLEEDTENIVYGLHKKMIYSSVENFYLYFGMIEDDNRLSISKKIYGKTADIIMNNIDKNVQIRPDLIEVYKHSDSMISMLTKDGIDPDSYKKEIDRIIERLEYVKKQRYTIDELKTGFMANENIGESEEEPDKPFVSMKQSE